MKQALLLAALALGLSGASAAAAGDPDMGKSKARQCAVCHGIDGIAKRPDVPHIAGESPIYLDEQLAAFREGRRHHEQMTIIATGLNEADIADLIAWYSAIELSVTLPD